VLKGLAFCYVLDQVIRNRHHDETDTYQDNARSFFHAAKLV
jgi:hypothetical protein